MLIADEKRRKPVRFDGPLFVGFARIPLTKISYLGKSKIERLRKCGIQTVEDLAKIDTSRQMAMLVTRNSRPDLAMRTLYKWKKKAQLFLQSLHDY